MDLGDLFDFEAPGRHRDRRDHRNGHQERHGSAQGDEEYPDARQSWKNRGHDDHGDEGEGLGFSPFKHPLPMLFANKKALVIVGIVLAVLLVVAAYFLLPLAWQAVQYVEKNGVQGVINRIWKGSGS
jgi:hypothetical protein